MLLKQHADWLDLFRTKNKPLKYVSFPIFMPWAAKDSRAHTAWTVRGAQKDFQYEEEELILVNNNI